jgi:hypothetical protein
MKHGYPELPMVKIVSLDDFADLVVETAKSAEGEFMVISGLAVGTWAQYIGVPTGGPLFSNELPVSGSPAPETLTGTGFRMGRGNGR